MIIIFKDKDEHNHHVDTKEFDVFLVGLLSVILIYIAMCLILRYNEIYFDIGFHIITFVCLSASYGIMFILVDIIRSMYTKNRKEFDTFLLVALSTTLLYIIVFWILMFNNVDFSIFRYIATYICVVFLEIIIFAIIDAVKGGNR